MECTDLRIRIGWGPWQGLGAFPAVLVVVPGDSGRW